MSNLSKREAFLLFLMALIVPIALIFQFLISPLQANLLDKQSQLSGLELQRQQMETSIALIPSLRVRREARFSEVESKLQEFSSPIHAAEFERWILPLFSKYNIRVVSASFTPTQIATPAVNMDVVPPQMYELLALIQAMNNIEVVASPIVPTTTTQLLFAEYKFTFTTNLDKYLALIDEIKAWDTTFIVSSSFFSPNDNFASITLQIFSVDKLTDEEVLGIYKEDFGIHPNEVKGPTIPSNPK